MTLTKNQIDRLVSDKSKADRFDKAMELSGGRWAKYLCDIILATDDDGMERFYLETLGIMRERKDNEPAG